MAIVKRIKHIDVIERVQKGTKEAVLEVAKVGVGYAVKLAPVDTGHLRQSIASESTGETTAVFGSNIEYAPYQEFGTSQMKAQPYLRPAADKLRTTGSRIFAKLLKGVLDHG